MTTTDRATAVSIWVAALLFGVVVGGCAGNGAVSTAKISAAEQAISTARERGAHIFAQSALQSAQEKVAEAKIASDDGEDRLAQRMAEEALADADYARARANTALTQKMVTEVRESVEMLRREIQRAPAPQ